MRIQVSHGFFPRPRRVFVRHREHPIDEIRNGPGILSLVLGRNRHHSARSVVAGLLARPACFVRRLESLVLEAVSRALLVSLAHRHTLSSRTQVLPESYSTMILHPNASIQRAVSHRLGDVLGL